MLDWPLVVSPRSTKELIRARSAFGPGHRAPTRLITHAKRGFMEHIARLTHRSAAVHSNDSPVRCARQWIAETLKQCSLSGLACSSAARGQNIRCPHARGPVPTFLAASRHNWACILLYFLQCRIYGVYPLDTGTAERSAVMTVLHVTRSICHGATN
jgi:hypothetical protein